MAKQGILDIEKLNRYAKDYDNVLRTLPYFTTRAACWRSTC